MLIEIEHAPRKAAQIIKKIYKVKIYIQKMKLTKMTRWELLIAF